LLVDDVRNPDLIDRLEAFGALVIVRRDERPIPGERRLLAAWSECSGARPVLLRPALDPRREPAQKRGGG
jgi:hypothetical protein